MVEASIEQVGHSDCRRIIWTDGIGLALDALGMEFDEVLALVRLVMPRLDEVTIASKVALDQTLADWVEPLLPPEKRVAWRAPSMYGNPDKQTVGGGVVPAAAVRVARPYSVWRT